MSYSTTHHPFVIDDKHPADVFDEMSNFFSLYTVTLDAFHQMSIGLTVPAEFDIENNAKLHTAYQNFIKAIRYSIPDVNVLPIQTAQDDGQVGAGMLELMIQYHEGRMIRTQTNTGLGESKPKFYQKMLGVMLPNFDVTQSPEGLYPQRPEPVVPVIAHPLPTVAPQPPVQPQYQNPPVQNQPPQYQPLVPPQPQVIPTTVPVAKPQPIPQPAYKPPVTPVASPPPIHYLPKPILSIKPYRELLTQAIIEQAKQDKAKNVGNEPISEITLKSKDSLTTAMIETLFAAFNTPANSQTGQRAYDAIDLASYGMEELRPKLRQIGIAISDEAQFSLNAKAKATANDLEKIRQGMANSADIHLTTQLQYGSATATPNATNDNHINQTATHQTSASQNIVRHSTASQSATPVPQPIAQHPANANTLNIAINIKVSDSMGERTVKVREFPVAFSTQNAPSQPAKLVKIISKQVTGEMFYLSEQDGQLLAKNVASNIVLQRDGQASNLQENATLLPNDIVEIANDVQVALLLN